MPRGVIACPCCDFTISDLGNDFLAMPVRCHSLDDRAGLLKWKERQKVQLALKRFRKKFPQGFVAVQSVSLPDAKDLALASFWLLNHASFEDLSNENNESGWLLLIDIKHKQAMLSCGYRWEPFFSEANARHCLEQASSAWLEGRYAQAILITIQALEKHLVRLHKNILSSSDLTPENHLESAPTNGKNDFIDHDS